VPRIYARWRVSGGQVERPIGPRWLVRAGDPGAEPNVGDWRDRRGRPDDGFLTVDAARERVPAIMSEWAREKASAARRAARANADGKTVSGVVLLPL